MRFYTIPVLLMAAVPWTASAAVDPGLLDLAPPETKVLSGIQVEQALRSSFGQFALTKVPQNDGLTQFMAATGFDFRRDLREILVATDGTPVNSGGANNLILIRGAFQPAKIAALAAVVGATSSSYAGIPILTPPGNAQPISGAFLDPDTLVMGSVDAIKNAIDRRTGGAHYSGALAQKAIAASGVYDLWAATVAPLSTMNIPSLGGVATTAFSSITEASAGIRFDAAGANVTGEAVTKSGQDALAIAGMGQLLLAMAQSGKGPRAQSGAALLQSAQIAADGPAVRLTLSIPEQELEQMFAAPPAARKVSLPAQ